MSNECEGCVMHGMTGMYKNHKWCILVRNKTDKGCPCKGCLIKVMCKNSCEVYDRYVESCICSNKPIGARI